MFRMSHPTMSCAFSPLTLELNACTSSSRGGAVFRSGPNGGDRGAGSHTRTHARTQNHASSLPLLSSPFHTLHPHSSFPTTRALTHKTHTHTCARTHTYTHRYTQTLAYARAHIRACSHRYTSRHALSLSFFARAARTPTRRSSSRASLQSSTTLNKCRTFCCPNNPNNPNNPYAQCVLHG